MRREVFKRGPLATLRTILAPLIFTLVIIGAILYGLRQTEQSNSGEGLRILQEGLTRAAVTCYVVEGRYPGSVAYIEERYGVRVDRTRYVAHYDAFASNILPQIMVSDIRGSGYAGTGFGE